MTDIIHKRGRGEPGVSAFSEPGELAIDVSTGRVYTLTDSNTVVCVGPKNSPGGGAGPRHTMYAKATYSTDATVSTDRFQALKYDMTPYHSSIGQYTYGFKFGKRFGTDDTTGLEWDVGCYVELYDSGGALVFAAEADQVEHNSDGTLTVSWQDQAKLYQYGIAGRHGDAYLVKVGNLGGTVIRQAVVENREPPPDE